MVNKVLIIKRRWKEVVKDLSEQHGIDSKALLQKMPAFAGSDSGLSGTHLGHAEHILDFKSVSRSERRVLRSAADTIAEVIIALVPVDHVSEEAPPEFGN